MNVIPDGAVVVLDLAGHVASLVCRSPALEPTLRELGFAANAAHMLRPITDDTDRRQLAEILIGLDVLFAEGTGWSPAELLELYRERRALPASYRTISWLGPREFRVSRHPR